MSLRAAYQQWERRHVVPPGSAWTSGDANLPTRRLLFVWSEIYFVVKISLERCVWLGRAVLWRAPDDGKHRRCNPADSFVAVIKAANFEADDGVHIGMSFLQSVVMFCQIANSAASGI
jgi:hypothetical protein